MMVSDETILKTRLEALKTYLLKQQYPPALINLSINAKVSPGTHKIVLLEIFIAKM